jgi:predicted membrane chloride channel (bestrophin family)
MSNKPWEADDVWAASINRVEIDETRRQLTEASRDRRMPYGKHKGIPLRRLPTDYLRCLRDQLRDEDREDDLRDLIETEWEARSGPHGQAVCNEGR